MLSIGKFFAPIAMAAALLCAATAPAAGYHNLPRATDQPAYECPPEWPRRIVNGRTYYFTPTCYECPTCTVAVPSAVEAAPRYAPVRRAATAKVRTQITTKAE